MIEPSLTLRPELPEDAMNLVKAPDLSIVICTHNPRDDYLYSTLSSIAGQETLAEGRSLEFIIVDNASVEPLAGRIMLPPIDGVRIVREEKLGLTHARLRSFYEAKGRVILYIDDDNVLCPTYLRDVLAAFDADPQLGAVGGKALPRYEVPPPNWFVETGLGLACRDLGEQPLAADWTMPGAPRDYPDCAPIGAGMAIRREAYAAYVTEALNDPMRLALGRKGADLASGEDNDMILTLLEHRWRIAYLPQLSLDHLIPARRLTEDYLQEYAFSSNRTWVQVLALHGICAWKPIPRWTLAMRKARAWLVHRAWRGPVERIAWRSSCGLFEGRASLKGLIRS